MFTFGPFLLDLANEQLVRDGKALPLQPRPFALLHYLIQNAGHLVPKDALLDSVWGHRFVGDSVLKGAIATLRAVLEDDPKAPCWIETVNRRGYRFVGVVESRPVEQDPWTGGGGSLEPRLHGRDSDVATLEALLQRGRLVTLVGAGGIGKTSVALRVARCWQALRPGMVRVVRLESLADPQALVVTIARALGLSDASGSSVDALARALQASSLLVLLDNCEHLIHAVATLASKCLAQAPQIRILATSREPLRLSVEQVHQLSPLAVPPLDQLDRAEEFAAPAMLVERIQALLPDFRLTEGNRKTVCELCDALDGLPLALELAAARVPLLGVQGVHARLTDRLRLLVQGARDAEPRQRTLRDTLAWSHALLGDLERRVFRRLAVFAGGFTLEAVQAVMCDSDLDDWVVLDALDSLLRKSLIVVQETAPSLPRPPATDVDVAHAASVSLRDRRLRMFDSVRSYAMELMVANGEARLLQNRHQEWVLHRWRAAASIVHDVPVFDWLDAMTAELPELRLALRHALASDLDAAAIELFALGVLVWHRALKSEASYWWSLVSPLAKPSVPHPVLGRFRQAEAMLCASGNPMPSSSGTVAGREALALHREAGESFEVYLDLYLLFYLAIREAPREDHSDLLVEMMQVESPEWSALRRRYARWVQALIDRYGGRVAEYRSACYSELDVYRSAGDQFLVWNTTYQLALALHDNGQSDTALEALEAMISEVRQAGRTREFGNARALLLATYLLKNDASSAVAVARETMVHLQSEGWLWWMAFALPLLPHAQGRWDDALRLFGWAEATMTRRAERPGLFASRLRQHCQESLRHSPLTEAQAQASMEMGAMLNDDSAVELALLGCP